MSDLPVDGPVSGLPADEPVSGLPADGPVSGLPVDGPVSRLPRDGPASHLPVADQCHHPGHCEAYITLTQHSLLYSDGQLLLTSRERYSQGVREEQGQWTNK